MGEKRRENLRLITQYSAGAVELGVSVAVGAGIGYWLDTALGARGYRTAPWMTLLWLLAGVVAGFRSLFRLLRRLEEEEGSKDGDDKGA
jgi:ATP synthase protein I